MTERIEGICRCVVRSMSENQAVSRTVRRGGPGDLVVVGEVMDREGAEGQFDALAAVAEAVLRFELVLPGDR